VLKKIKTTAATASAFLAAPAFAIAAEHENGSEIGGPLRWDNICDAITDISSFFIGIAGLLH
jgi:hypothetical protein